MIPIGPYFLSLSVLSDYSSLPMSLWKGTRHSEMDKFVS